MRVPSAILTFLGIELDSKTSRNQATFGKTEDFDCIPADEKIV